LDVELYLDADDGAYEETDEQHDADGIDTKRTHLADVLAEEHSPPFGNAQDSPHQLQVPAKSCQPLRDKHSFSKL
jgi:hypothetical protein